MFTVPEPVLDTLFSYIQLTGLWLYVCPQQSKKASACVELCDYLTCRSGKNLSCLSIYYMTDALATLGYFASGLR
jgi:hypothetical protein